MGEKARMCGTNTSNHSIGPAAHRKPSITLHHRLPGQTRTVNGNVGLTNGGYWPFGRKVSSNRLGSCLLSQNDMMVMTCSDAMKKMEKCPNVAIRISANSVNLNICGFSAINVVFCAIRSNKRFAYVFDLFR